MPEEAKTQEQLDQEAAAAGEGKPKGDEGAQEGERVVLSPEQYNALLDHVSTLESRLMEQPEGRREVKKLDDLIDEATEGQPKGKPLPKDANLEDMTPQQVLGQLMQAIHQQFIQPLETKVETLRIMSEIDKVANKKGNEDFWDYAQEVKAIAIKNPTLSIQQAYDLAKTGATRKPKGEGETGLHKKSDLLYTLPPRVKGAMGEKPGASGTQLKGTQPVSRRDAASAAFDRVTGGKA